MSAPEADQPLKLEVGKSYRARDGRKRRIVGCDASDEAYPFEEATGRWYTARGMLAGWEGDPNYRSHLVAEWDAPDADGWIQWAGGECPVPPETVVNWRTEGKEPGEETWALKARDLDWSVVTAYRIVTRASEDSKQEPQPAEAESEARATAHFEDVLALRRKLGEKTVLAKELAQALEDAVDSLKYVQTAHPEATGCGVRAERIQKAEAALARYKVKSTTEAA